MTDQYWIEIDKVIGTTANMDRELLKDLKKTVSMLIYDAESKGQVEKATRLHYAHRHATDYRGEEKLEPSEAAVRLMMANDPIPRWQALRDAPKQPFYIITAKFDEARAVEYRMRFHG